MKNKILLWINIIVAIVMLSLNVLYLFVWHTTSLLKDGNSILFVLLGILNFAVFYKDCTKKYKLVSLFIVLGLIFGMLGDFLLGKNFILGAVLFAIGHIFYIISFVCIKKYTLKDFAVLLILLAVFAFILLIPNIYFGQYLPLVLGYAFVISVMTAKAISNLIFEQKDFQNILLCIGAVLFYVSDLMLMFYNFANPLLVYDYLCLLTYIPSQIMFAISIFKFKNKERQ